MSNVVESKTAGWRPDPSGRYEWRYWDNGWTNRVANSAAPKPATGRPSPPTPRRVPPDTAGTAPPPSDAEVAVLRAVAAGRGRPRSASAALPAGPPAAAGYAPARGPQTRTRRGVLGVFGRWFRALADEEESYHSPKAGVPLDPHPKGDSILAAGPRNYGQAGLVALAAFGLGVGAYLPWLSGTIAIAPFERTGFDLGRAWGFTWLAAAIVIAALLAVQMRPLRYVSMGLAVVAAALTARELLETHELITSMNRSVGAHAELGVGLWIMIAAAAGVLVASFRTSTPE